MRGDDLLSPRNAAMSLASRCVFDGRRLSRKLDDDLREIFQIPNRTVIFECCTLTRAASRIGQKGVDASKIKSEILSFLANSHQS